MSLARRSIARASASAGDNQTRRHQSGARIAFAQCAEEAHARPNTDPRTAPESVSRACAQIRTPRPPSARKSLDAGCGGRAFAASRRRSGQRLQTRSAVAAWRRRSGRAAMHRLSGSSAAAPPVACEEHRTCARRLSPRQASAARARGGAERRRRAAASRRRAVACARAARRPASQLAHGGRRQPAARALRAGRQRTLHARRSSSRRCDGEAAVGRSVLTRGHPPTHRRAAARARSAGTEAAAAALSARRRACRASRPPRPRPPAARASPSQLGQKAARWRAASARCHRVALARASAGALPRRVVAQHPAAARVLASAARTCRSRRDRRIAAAGVDDGRAARVNGEHRREQTRAAVRTPSSDCSASSGRSALESGGRGCRAPARARGARAVRAELQLV